MTYLVLICYWLCRFKQSSVLREMKSSILFPLATIFSMCLCQDNSFLMITPMDFGIDKAFNLFHVQCILYRLLSGLYFSVLFFLLQWNIVEGGVKHHKHKPKEFLLQCIFRRWSWFASSDVRSLCVRLLSTWYWWAVINSKPSSTNNFISDEVLLSVTLRFLF